MSRPCFLAVERTERIRAKSSAPFSSRKPPDIFCRGFIIRPSRSARLLLNGRRGSARKRSTSGLRGHETQPQVVANPSRLSSPESGLRQYGLRGMERQTVRENSGVIPAALKIDPCPGAAGHGLNALRIADEEVPSILAGGDDGLIGVPDTPAELVAAEIVPDIFHWVEFR
jgi:hypothetical protein